jgi:arginyl-tRNA synthetase
VDCHSPPVNVLAIKQVLLHHLQAALSSFILNTPFQTSSKSYIPLQLSRQLRVAYSCAIAFKLSNLVNLPAIEVAQSLLQPIIQQTHQHNLIIQVVPPGWIYLELTQPSLAAWLQHWVETLPSLGSREQGVGEKRVEGVGEATSNYPLPITHYQSTIHNPQSTIQNSLTPDSLFPIQYAHARCCSLLQMAHQEGLIGIKSRNSDNKSWVWEMESPQPIPWLDREEEICFNLPVELNLIIQLIAVLDDLYCPEPTRQVLNWLKIALNLSQAFQTFYSQCRIWGEVKSQNLNLAQARLGLVAIAQSVLRILLVDVLGSFAPPEL